MNIPAFVSERFVITVKAGNVRKKLFQIMFQKKDGSMFVAFPYYKDTTGILTLSTLNANATYPAKLPLKIGGKVTGHKVKYTHHPDGTVHFSQDSKILSNVRKQSVPLTNADGHIFTVQLQGLDDFTNLKEREKKPTLTAKKTILNFNFEGEPPVAYKFVGHWYTKKSLMEKITQFGNKPWFVCEKPNNKKSFGMLISNPFLNSRETNYLLLTCEGIPFLGDHKSQLIFIGGFDHKNTALDHAKDTQFLALAYPITEDYKDLLNEIGTVDYETQKNI